MNEDKKNIGFIGDWLLRAIFVVTLANAIYAGFHFQSTWGSGLCIINGALVIWLLVLIVKDQLEKWSDERTRNKKS